MTTPSATDASAVQPSTPIKTGNGMGVAALVIGILALVGAFIPFVNFVSGFLAFVGLVLGIIALFLKGRTKGTAIAGTVISGIALILSIVMALVYAAVFAAAVNQTIEESEAAADVDVVVTYEVDGDSTDASVTYSTWSDGTSGTQQATEQTLPFTHEVTVKAGGDFDFSSYSLIGNNGQTGTDITCRILVDGEVVSEQTSSGQYAMVSCTSTD